MSCGPLSEMIRGRLQLLLLRSVQDDYRSGKVNLEDPTCCRTIVVWPARMDAGIATDQLAVVHRQAVRIAGVRNKVHRLQHLAGRGIIPYQTRPVFAIPFTIIADDLPDAPVVPGDAVVTHTIRRL